MAWVLLLLGISLVAVSGASVLRQVRETGGLNKTVIPAMVVPGGFVQDNLSPPLQVVTLEEVLDVGARVELLADTVDLLLTKIGRLETRFVNWEQQLEVISPNNFDNQPEKATPGTLQQRIREAYAAGKGVTELAQQFCKGKGEIELILNLKR
ncbi:MAG: hypothetical protein ACYCX4_16745 [Bacillota bacterium]